MIAALCRVATLFFFSLYLRIPFSTSSYLSCQAYMPISTLLPRDIKGISFARTKQVEDVLLEQAFSRHTHNDSAESDYS